MDQKCSQVETLFYNQQKMVFLVWMFSVKIYIPSNLDQRKKGDIKEMIINNHGTWKLSETIGRHECPYNNLFKHTN